MTGNGCSQNRRAFWAVLVASALGASGCGAMVDTYYALSDKSYRETATHARPTGQTISRLEVDGTITPDGRVGLRCELRTRSIDRNWQVEKTWRYRGGYTRDGYGAAAFSSGVGAALIGGISTGICLGKQNSDFSCWNAAFAAPWLVDLGYSLIRRAYAQEPKLIRKDPGPEWVALGAVPIVSENQGCRSTVELMVGTATTPVGVGDELTATKRLDEGALRVLYSDDGSVDLATQPEALFSLAGSGSIGLWAVETSGDAVEVRIDRCDLVRAALPRLARETRAVYDREARVKFEARCPVPAPGAEAQR